MSEHLNHHLLVSCISTKLSILKKYWAKEKHLEPLIRGSKRKPPINVGGLLCLLDVATGEIKYKIDIDFPSGINRSENGIFVATRYAIHEVAPDLSSIQRNLISLPQFNALHSMSCRQNRYLIASTGMDLLVEFDRHGRVLWQWWATDHGLAHTPKGHVRKIDQIDKEADHRGIDYGTINQTTHINSAVAICDEFVLATLFHQGMVIKICKESGKWWPILEGLDHPHAVRMLDDAHFTVADTGNGRGLRVALEKGEIMEEVCANTTWLQDCHYDPVRGQWILVDGTNSVILIKNNRTGQQKRFKLDKEWRLYEVMLF